MLVPTQSVAATTEEPQPGTEVTISPVDLDGPTISTVEVTVKNTDEQRLHHLKVTFAGPTGWAVEPPVREVKGTLGTGAEAATTFRIQVPEMRPGFMTRTFTATATYQGGDGLGTATATRVQKTGEPLPNIQAAFNNVAITDESNTLPGNYDGEGNSFSAQKLADVGLTPGAQVDALGAKLTWPNVPAGTKNNVSSAGQAIALNGNGSKLVFLGSGVGSGAAGNATVYYTDGTTTTGWFGFPNWSFAPADAHGATLIKSTDGRNRPDGYGNAGIAYRIFANSIPLDPAKTVELVVLPANGTVHVFDVAIAP
ncbi:hypothetical protein AQ490_26970 [Wenjunlia vitaminophila]|uniref:Alpha-galactosidase NEW3 domain-containing protein n=1 Tax=Wenjunlia vitaminophila TaxID=76728 RepID=A0A0T6LPZ3_WENVI|nr:hypothetical protein AQ490_26970 [Wenjunlia vitaminophila]